MTKKILYTIAIIFLLLSVGLFYVNKVLLPVQVKGMIIKAAEEQLGRKVTLDSLHWDPLRGLVITNLTIASKEQPEEIFVHIKSASAQILFLPMIQKKIIIPSVKIDTPSIRLVRTDENTWNFSDLLTSKTTTTDNQPPLDVLISGFSLINGRVKITDLAKGEPFTEFIEPINLKGSLSLTAGFHLTGDIAIPSTKGLVQFNTRTGFKDKSFKGDFKVVNVLTTKYLRFMPAASPVTISGMNISDAQLTALFQNNALTLSGNATIPGADISPTETMRIKGDLAFQKMFLTFNNGAVTFQGNVSAYKMFVALNPTQTLEGNLVANILNFSLNKDRISYSGSLVAQSAKAALNDMQSVSGNLKISDIKLSWQNGKITAKSDLEIKNFLARLSEKQKIQGDITLPALTITQNDQGLTAASDMTVKRLSVTLDKDQTISGDLSMTKARLFFADKNISLKSDLALKGASVTLPDLTAKADIAAPQLVIDLEDNVLDLQTQVNIKNLAVTLSGGAVFSGNPSITLSLTVPTQAPDKLSYAGTIQVSDGILKGLPNINTIENIKGKIILETDHATVKNIKLVILDTPVNASAEISNFKKPFLKVDASAKGVNLALVQKVIPQIMTEQGLTISGKADLEAHLEGQAAKLDAAKIIASATLTDTGIESSKLKQSVQKINGFVEYKSPTLSWKDLSLVYQDKKCFLNGYLQDFSNPYLATSFKTENIALDVQAKKTGDNIHIESLSGNWFESSFNAAGRVTLPKEQEPLLDVTVDSKLSLRDLPRMLPAYAKQLEALKLGGIIKIESTLKGQAKDWQRLSGSLAIQTPALYCMGYQVENLNISATQKEGIVDPLDIKGSLYKGEFGIISTINLLEKGFPFESTFKLDGTNLELLKRDTPLKQKQLSGFLALAGELKGQLTDLKNMEGKITTQVTDGYLWELEILSKVLGILSSSFQGGDIIITDANATFDVSQGKIATNNLTMKSATVTLLGEGWVDFDQNIDFNVTPRIEPKTSSDGTTSVFNAINPTAGLLNIHIAGTLKEPKFEHNISAPQILKKTLQNTVGGLLKLFE